MNPPDVWHSALDRLQREARPHALASVVGVAGSTPREPGAKMVITPEAIHDTLGGGNFELQVINAARDALAQGESGTRLEAFPLGGRSGQCCGGYVHVLLELFAGAEMRVALFGAGNVSRALTELLAPLPWQVLWFDSREDAFPAADGNERQQRRRIMRHRRRAGRGQRHCRATPRLPRAGDDPGSRRGPRHCRCAAAPRRLRLYRTDRLALKMGELSPPADRCRPR